MPRPRQAQGRPGTPVIPAGWASSHAAIVAGASNGSLPDWSSIRRPGLTAGTLNRATGHKDGATAAAAHFTGPCRLDPAAAQGGGERLQIVADEQATQTRIAIVLQHGAAPATEVDDIVTVTGVGDFVVVCTEDASETFGRVVYATRHLPQT